MSFKDDIQPAVVRLSCGRLFIVVVKADLAISQDPHDFMGYRAPEGLYSRCDISCFLHHVCGGWALRAYCCNAIKESIGVFFGLPICRLWNKVDKNGIGGKNRPPLANQ
jgi:hypothetical protein